MIGEPIGTDIPKPEDDESQADYAMRLLTQHMEADNNYATGWHLNFTSSCTAEGWKIEKAKKAATSFLRKMFGFNIETIELDETPRPIDIGRPRPPYLEEKNKLFPKVDIYTLEQTTGTRYRVYFNGEPFYICRYVGVEIGARDETVGEEMTPLLTIKMDVAGVNERDQMELDAYEKEIGWPR